MIWCQMWMSGFLICIFRYVAFTTDFRTGSLINLYLCCCQEIIFLPLPHSMCYSHCQIPGVLWHPQYPRYLPPWAYCSIYCCFITETIAKDKIQCHRLWQDILCKFAYYCLHHVNSFGHFIKVSNSFVLFPFHLSKRNVILQNHIVQNDKKMHMRHNWIPMKHAWKFIQNHEKARDLYHNSWKSATDA